MAGVGTGPGAGAPPVWDVRAVLDNVAALEQQLADAAGNGALRVQLSAVDAAQAALRAMVLPTPGYHIEDGTEAGLLPGAAARRAGSSLTILDGARARSGSASAVEGSSGHPLTVPTGSSSVGQASPRGTGPPLSPLLRASALPGPSDAPPSPSGGRRTLEAPPTPSGGSGASGSLRGPSPSPSVAHGLDQVERLAVIENAGQDTAWYFNYFLGARTFAYPRIGTRARPLSMHSTHRHKRASVHRHNR
jgi:hypothetical protein